MREWDEVKRDRLLNSEKQERKTGRAVILMKMGITACCRMPVSSG